MLYMQLFYLEVIMNKENYPITKLLNHIAKNIHLFHRNHLKDYDMGWGQFRIIITLFHKEGINQEKLSNVLGIDKTTMTRTLKKMEISDLIEKKNNPDDKRAHLIHLTDKSRNLQSYLNQLKSEIDIKLLDGFTEEEITLVFSLLSRLEENSKLLLEEK